MAAPLKSPADRLNQRILLVVTARQRKVWVAEAKRQNISLAELIRRTMDRSLS